MIKILIKNNYLLGQLVKKDIGQRYTNSVLGMLWSVIVPVLMIIIYTFVFSEIFQAKWNMDTSNKYEFALVLFCGLSTVNMLSEVMNRSVVLIAANTNYVKKVIFPLEILPAVVTVSALFNCVISYVILILARLILCHDLSKTLYQGVLVFIPLFCLSFGVCYILSAVSVYMKDISNIISVLVMILMYISPVFFPLDAVPKRYQVFCKINPMTYIIENFRNTILYETSLDWKYFGISCLVAFGVYLLGKVIFMRTKEGFADVL